MDINEKIAQLQGKLNDLNHPPKEISGTIVEFSTSHCDKHGDFECRTRLSTGQLKIPSRPSECPGCMQDAINDLQNEQARISSSLKASKIERLKGELLIPERFADCSLENYEAGCEEAKRALRVCQAYASKWPERLKRGGGLIMCGKPGTGKNHLAFAIARRVIEDHQSSVTFTTALKIAREFKSTWSKTSTRTEDDVISQFTVPDLLIIDEVGVQFGSESEKLIMFEIINTRYEHMRPTILISNESKDDLAGFIGERVIDRMNEGGGCTLAFTWESYRTKVRA